MQSLFNVSPRQGEGESGDPGKVIRLQNQPTFIFIFLPLEGGSTNIDGVFCLFAILGTGEENVANC